MALFGELDKSTASLRFTLQLLSLQLGYQLHQIQQSLLQILLLALEPLSLVLQLPFLRER